MGMGEDGFILLSFFLGLFMLKMYERHNQDLILSYKSFSKWRKFIIFALLGRILTTKSQCGALYPILLRWRWPAYCICSSWWWKSSCLGRTDGSLGTERLQQNFWFITYWLQSRWQFLLYSGKFVQTAYWPRLEQEVSTLFWTCDKWGSLD